MYDTVLAVYAARLLLANNTVYMAIYNLYYENDNSFFILITYTHFIPT